MALGKRLVVALAFGVAAVGCGGSTSSTTTEGAPIKIGTVQSMTGSAASNGIPIANGSQVAVDEINNAGGVKVGNQKRKLQLAVYDDAGTPETGLAALTRMVEQDNTHLMVGVVASNVGEGLIPYFKRHDSDLAVIIDGATSARLTAETTNVFRMQAPIKGYVLSNAAFQAQQGYKKVAIVTDITNPAQVAVTPDLLNYYKSKGMDVVANVETKRGQGDFSSVITKIKPFNPDVVFVRVFTDDELAFVKQSREQGWNVPVTATVFTSQSAIGQGIPANDMTNVFEIVPPTNDNLVADGNANAKKVAAAYQAKYNAAPGNLTLQGYEAVKAMAAAISQAGTDSPSKVIAALGSLKPYPDILFPIDTSGGTVFGKDHEVSVKFVVYQWTAGQPTRKGTIAST